MSKPFKFRPKRDARKSGRTNQMRADRAEVALKAHEGGERPDESHFADLLTDLMHLADRYQRVFKHALDAAYENYMEER